MKRTSRGPGGSRSPYRRSSASYSSRGQTVVEYLLMTLMLLFLSTTLYWRLQEALKTTFQNEGQKILYAYY